MANKDYFANRQISHFKKYLDKDGVLDADALVEKEGLNEKQIAQLTEILTPKKEEAEDTESNEGSSDLETMTKAELLALAQAEGVEVKTSWTKAELITALS